MGDDLQGRRDMVRLNDVDVNGMDGQQPEFSTPGPSTATPQQQQQHPFFDSSSSSSKPSTPNAPNTARTAAKNALALLDEPDAHDIAEEERKHAQTEAANKKARKKKPGPIGRFILSFKKIDNRMQYLSSKLIDKNPALVSAFRHLLVSRMDQISLLEFW
jgi:hypothetical protein